MLKKVSVVIPFTRVQDVKDCLDSLSLQTLRKERYEVILIGESLKVKDYENEICILSVVCKNRHPGIRRNMGVQASTGDCLLFLDDDTCVRNDFLENVLKKLNEYPGFIIAGPNRDSRKGFRFEFPTAIQENIFTEGLISHKNSNKDYINTSKHNMPLCNLAMNREVFEKCGGLNEFASYYIDDVEFLYIAGKLGFKLASFPELSVEHKICPAFLSYFKYKFLSRYRIGEIFFLYPELYINSFQIKSVFITYVILSLVLIFEWFWGFYTFMSIYFSLLIYSALSMSVRGSVRSVLVPGIFLTHLLVYLGFTLGLFKSFLDLFIKKDNIFKQKKVRYSVFGK